MHRKHTPLLVVATLALTACGSRPRVPVVTPRSTQITGVVTGGLAMRIDLLIYNPNNQALTVRSIHAEVTAQERDLGTVDHAQDFTLPAGQNTPFSTDLTVPWGDLPSLAATALLQAAIPYRVEGRVRVSGASNFSVRVPFDLEGQIPRSMLMQMPGIPSVPLPTGFK